MPRKESGRGPRYSHSTMSGAHFSLYRAWLSEALLRSRRRQIPDRRCRGSHHAEVAFHAAVGLSGNRGDVGSPHGTRSALCRDRGWRHRARLRRAARTPTTRGAHRRRCRGNRPDGVGKARLRPCGALLLPGARQTLAARLGLLAESRPKRRRLASALAEVLRLDASFSTLKISRDDSHPRHLPALAKDLYLGSVLDFAELKGRARGQLVPVQRRTLLCSQQVGDSLLLLSIPSSDYVGAILRRC